MLHLLSMHKLLTYILYLLIIAACLPMGLPAQEIDSLDKDSITLAHKVTPAIVGIEANVKDLRYYGTGAIIHPNGIILTTTCVIPPGATNIKVFLSDNKVLSAQILAMDEDKETTLLKIEGKNLPCLLAGDSDHIKIGQTVYTLGNVLNSITDDGQTAMTKGIISGLYTLAKTNAYRLENRTGRYKGPIIETTAPINGGVDGGPLIASDGTIIGLITLNYAKARWLGLAIPINQIKPVLEEHKTRIETARPAEVDELFTHIAPKITPFIVGIKTELTVPRPRPKWPPRHMVSPFFPLPQKLSEELEAKYRDYVTIPEGFTSGVAIDSSGLVLTSYKSIIPTEAAKKELLRDPEEKPPKETSFGTGAIKSITVYWQNDPIKLNYPAEIVGWDEASDIILLKTQRIKNLAVPLNQTTRLKLGQWVAVGGFNPDPNMKQPTLTIGIASALARLKGKGFQLDAAVNYGNFGAPVFDIKGNFIGLVGQHGGVLQWGMNSGIGLAVSTEEITRILPRLKQGEKIKKLPVPFLGIQMARGALDIQGVQLDRVMTNTSARDAGLKKGDVVTEFNGLAIKEWRDLVKAITDSKVGAKIKIKIKRGRKTLELTAVLGERP